MKRKPTPKTPEEIAAERAAADLRFKEQQRAKAEARAKRKQESEEHVAKLIAFATTLKSNGATLENREALVLQNIGTEWLSTHEELVERQERFLECPANYFEWSESDMKLACKREILDHVLWELMSGKHVYNVVAEMTADLERRIMENYDRPTSTSPAHNALMVCKLDARCHFLRWNLRGWLRELSKHVGLEMLPGGSI